MQFEPHCLDALPPLAWALRIQRGTGTVELFHGQQVAVWEKAFFEGAWTGPFEPGDFLTAEVVLGSGGRVSGAGLHLTTPSHMLERLYSVRAKHTIWFSNSLALLFTMTGLNVDGNYRHYESDLTSFIRGTHRCRRTIPASEHYRIRLHYRSTIEIGESCRILEHPHPPAPSFRSYEEYTGFLRRALQAAADNARATLRTQPYLPLATVSSGYDSTACAALSRDIGCTRAITFRRARDTFTQLDDSGAAIGEALGLRVKEFDREGYLTREDLPEVEFLAAGTGGEDVIYAATGTAMAGSFLLTGYLGDTLWGRCHPAPSLNAQCRMTYPAGASLSEFRLHQGFVHAPVPLFAHTSHVSLQSISNSAAMAPWQLGGDYDRPIPRRIAEEAGVPRELFGQAKKAVSHPFGSTLPLETIMSPHSMRAFLNFCARVPPFTSQLDRLVTTLGTAQHWVRQRFDYRLNAMARTWGIYLPPYEDVARRYAKPRSHDAILVLWALDEMIQRYHRAIGPAAK